MDRCRRNFMSTILPLALVAPLALLVSRAAGQGEGRHQRTLPPPRQSSSPDPTAQDAPKVDPKLIQQQNQKKIQQDIQKLYRLAGELKEQVEKTDSANVLSLSLIGKAREIEKLAKQIASLAQG